MAPGRSVRAYPWPVPLVAILEIPYMLKWDRASRLASEKTRSQPPFQNTTAPSTPCMSLTKTPLLWASAPQMCRDNKASVFRDGVEEGLDV